MTPLDLRDFQARRVFARGLVADLRRIGSATERELLDAGVTLLDLPASEGELKQVTDVSRRMGWIEARDGEWSLTELGRSVSPPESLQLSQVVTRVLRSADPVRKHATDWLPLLAVIVGAAAAARQQTEASEGDTLTALRVLSIGVLSGALVRGGIGEVGLRKAARSFTRLQTEPCYGPIRDFYSWKRLGFVATFDAAVLVAFGLAIFLEWPAVLVPVAVALAVYLVLEFKWRTPARRCRRKERGAAARAVRLAVPVAAPGAQQPQRPDHPHRNE